MRALECVFFVIAPPTVLFLVLFMLRSELRKNWRAVVVLALACAAFFHRLLFLGEALSQSDANLLQMEFFSVYRDAIWNFGEIPFWNRFEGLGLANLAHPLSAMFYPLAPVFLASNTFLAMNVFVVSHFLLGGVFALLLGRGIFKNPQAAFALAVLYAFNGWAVTRAAHQPAIEYMFAYTWLPLAALAFLKAIDGHVFPAVVCGGAALAWMGTACPNFFVYAVLFLTVAAALKCISLLLGGAKNATVLAVSAALLAAVFAAALGAVEYFPARELAAHSTSGRMGVRLPEDWRGRALSLPMMLKLYLPFVTSRPFAVYYSPGVAALVAAIYGLYRAIGRKVHRDLALSCVIVLTIGVSLLSKSFPYYLLAKASDTFARSSLIPAGLVFLFVPVIVLAAIGVEAATSRPGKYRIAFGWAAALIIAAELFAVFAVVYPRHGERRLTFDYKSEVADFPHLDYIAEQNDPGRILVVSPEGEVLAPSYALMARGLKRLNLHLSAFAPDRLKETVDGTLKNLWRPEIEALGVGWVVSTRELRRLGEGTVVEWPGAAAHYENSLYYPLHNEPAWLAWDKRVFLYRVANLPSAVRAEPPSRASILLGKSPGDLESLRSERAGFFQPWESVATVVETSNTLRVVLPDVAPTRYFHALTWYPGWRLSADASPVEFGPAAETCFVSDVPPAAAVLEARFEPSHWRLYLAMSAAAVVVAVIAAGSTVQKRLRGPHTPHTR